MKKTLCILLVFYLIGVVAMGQERKKIGLVLSGGGAKGVAHVGVLKVLEEAGIPIDYIVGTSMGAIVGGLYAIGYDAKTLDSLVRIQDWSFLLSDKVGRDYISVYQKDLDSRILLSIPFFKKGKVTLPSGAISGQNIYNLFLDLTLGYHDSICFKDLPFPFACVAADLVSGKPVVLKEGNLPLAMRTSMAIPGVFTPIVRDSMLLVDGGIANNFPVDVVKEMGADIVIGVDVSEGLKAMEDMTSVIGIVQQLTNIIGLSTYQKNRSLVDLYIKPDILPYTAASFDKVAIDSLLVRGERAGRSVWDEIIALKEGLGIRDMDFRFKVHNPYIKMDTFNINKINVKGISGNDSKWILKRINVQDSLLTKKDIQDKVSSIYGTGLFASVYSSLDNEKDGFILNLELTPRVGNNLNMGFRFDNDNNAALLLNTELKLGASARSTFTFTGRLSKTPYVRLDFSLGNIFALNGKLSYMYRYTDLNIYQEGAKMMNMDQDYHMIGLNLLDFYVRNLSMSFGLKYEYFKYRSILSKTRDFPSIKNEGLISYYAKMVYESYDKRYYPSKGSFLSMSYTLHTDNFYAYDKVSPFSSMVFDYEKPLRITRRVYVIPSVTGRILMGKEFSYSFRNFIGHFYDGHSFNQQLSFYGVSGTEYVDNTFLRFGLNFRYFIGSKHYVLLLSNLGFHDDNFFDVFSFSRSIFGGGIGYSYDSPIGPIDVKFTLSDNDKKVRLYFNLGYYF